MGQRDGVDGSRILQELQVGISDLIAFRDCPRKAMYGARRHTAPGEQDHASRTPEAGSKATAYGSCIHDVIDLIEDGWDDEPAIERAWAIWGSELGPDSLSLLKEDIEKFRTRDFGNVRTVLAEGEIRVLVTTMDDGRPVYFRARIDRLYERLDRPGSYIHVDYKSSKWQKSQDEVDEDLQMWAYNWGLCEFFPEIEELTQVYDQFRHGQVETKKTDAQRGEMREWLAVEMRKYFADHEVMEDGLPAPRFNQWCPYCPILESCQIVPELSDWALTRIAALNEDVPTAERLAEVSTPIDKYVERYADAQTAIKALERYTKSVSSLTKQLPGDEQRRLGFSVYERKHTTFTSRSLEELHEILGPRFYDLISVTKKSLETIEDEQERERALAKGQSVPGPKVVSRRRH